MRNSKVAVWGLLALSELGDCLFLSSIMIFLLSSGSTAFMATVSLSSMALPITFFGPVMGRFVDRCSQRLVLVTFSVALALLELALVWSSRHSAFSHEMKSVLFVAILFSMACFYHPSQMVVGQYLVPSLAENESDAYSRWELLRSGSALLGGLICFLVLRQSSPQGLIVADALTFLALGLGVALFWRSAPVHKAAQITPLIRYRDRFREILRNPSLRVGIVAAWIYALGIISVSQNFVSLAFKGGLAGASSLSLIFVLTYGAGIVGSFFYRRFLIGREVTEALVTVGLGAHVLVPLTVALALMKGSLILGVCAVVLEGLLAPFHQISVNCLVRRETKAGTYGETIGFMRLPRALLTTIGGSAFAYAVDHSGSTLALGISGGLLLSSSLLLGGTWARGTTA